MKTIQSMFTDLTNTSFIMATGIFATFKFLFGKYVFADWEFAGFLFTLVMIDTLIGVFRAIRNRDFDIKELTEFVEKIVLYSAGLAVGHSISHYTTEGERILIFVFVKDAIYTALLIRETVSILLHIYKRFPSKELLGAIKYLRGYGTDKLKNSEL